jgi:hypothetical protein
MGGAELSIHDPDFQAVFDPVRETLALRGNADGRVASKLEELIHQIHDRTASNVALDLGDLEFMAASCFNVFVAWVGLINDRPPDRRYRLQFTINPAVPWQRRSITTLTCFATDIVTVNS